MAGTDNNRPPAPYKGAMGRLSVLNQQLAGANAGAGGASMDTSLKPMMAGIESSIATETEKAELGSNMSELNRRRRLDVNSMREKTVDDALEMQNKPRAMDYINLGVSGLMLLESGANALADNTVVDVSRDVVVGYEMTKDENGNDVVSPVTESVKGKEIQKGDNIFSKVAAGIQFALPSVGYMREGQREADEARLDGMNTLEERKAIQDFQAKQFMEMQMVDRKRANEMADAMAATNAYVEGKYTEALNALKEAATAEERRAAAGRGRDQATNWRTHTASIFEQGDYMYGKPGEEQMDGEEYRRWVAGDGPGPGKPMSGEPGNFPAHPMSKDAWDIMSHTSDSAFLDLGKSIAVGESSAGDDGYNMMNGGTRGGEILTSGNSNKIIGRPLTGMTIDEIRAAGTLERGAPGRIHVAGQMQWAVTTGAFEDAVAAAGLSGDALFTKENQNRMTVEYIKSMPVVQMFLEGKATREQVIDGIPGTHIKGLSDKWMALKATNGKGKRDHKNEGNMATIDSSTVIAYVDKLLEPTFSRKLLEWPERGKFATP